jgi:hypothetical protein
MAWLTFLTWYLGIGRGFHTLELCKQPTTSLTFKSILRFLLHFKVLRIHHQQRAQGCGIINTHLSPFESFSPPFYCMYSNLHGMFSSMLCRRSLNVLSISRRYFSPFLSPSSTNFLILIFFMQQITTYYTATMSSIPFISLHSAVA